MTNTTGTATNQGRPFSIVGAVLAVIALFILPIIFGPAGIIFGGVGYARGDRPFGMYVIIGALVAMVLGFVLGAMVFNANH